MSVAPPPSLRPILAVLAVLDDRARDELGQLARRLDGLFGPVRPRGQEQGGEPDGFRGLTRRGPYDRLLLSEWALLDEAPDEFVRRAAAGEHGFYELETREPAHGLRLRAVFDAGPEQLGTPRIVQLAVLFVLLKRAIAANAELEWSVAQRPGVLHTRVNHESVGALLGARSNVPFERPDLAGEPPADETWIVGPPPSGDLAAFRVLHIREQVTAAMDAVALTFHRPGHRSVELVLPAPPPSSRKLLLTQPFPRDARPREHGSVAQPPPDDRPQWRALNVRTKGPQRIRFLDGTQQLAAWFDGGHVLIWSTSNLPTRGGPRPKHCERQRGAERVALGYFHQTPLEVLLRGESLQVTGWVESSAALGERRPAPGNGGAWVLGAKVYFLDDTGAFWSVGLDGAELKLEGTGFTDVKMEDDVLTAVALERGCARVHRVWGTNGGPFGEVPVVWVEPQSRARPIRGASLPRGAPAGSLLTREGSGVWFRKRLGGEPINLESELRTPDDELLAQPSTVTTGRPSPAWLRWAPGSSSFWLGDAEAFVVPRHPTAVSVSANGRFVAFVTREHTVELWDIARGVPLMLRHTEP